MLDDQFLDQPFDNYERLVTLSGLVRGAELLPEHWVLDVGGHPGSIARLLGTGRVVTADLPPAGNSPYVRASGVRLPFKDRAFAVALCSDVLEHVAPEQRDQFLAELYRVSSQWILVSGPFNTPCVQIAEQLAYELDQRSPTDTSLWLAEHLSQGLPDLQQTWAAFERMGGKCIAAPSGNLLFWFVLMGCKSLFENVLPAAQALKRFMPLFNRHFAGLEQKVTSSNSPAGPWKQSGAAPSGVPSDLSAAPEAHALPNAAPAYRHVLMISRDGRFPPVWRSQPHFRAATEIPEQDPDSEGRLRALHSVLSELTTALQDTLRSDRVAALHPEAAYVDKLERIVEQQEQELRKLRAISPMPSAAPPQPASLPGKFKLKLRKILGNPDD